MTAGRARGLRRAPLAAWLGAGLLFLGGTPILGGAPDAAGGRLDEARVAALVFPRVDVGGLRALGPGVLPVLARIYERADEGRRTQVAYAFYALGWKSPDARRVLMRDAHTTDTNLRLQVQWALGRVSNDPEVLEVLLANMQDDGNPLFRDKAACALASDQIHLTEEQKVYLYGRLVQALRDPRLQVRSIALQALRIHTGQTKGFDPDAPPEQREQAIRTWEGWVATYKDNL